jgi:undecaprenyl-diphosphatase
LILALLLVFRSAAVPAAMHMIGAGLTCTTLYRWLKRKTARPRPYQVHRDIVCAATPLDPFSFPSGHTLHAAAFSVVAVAYYPALVWLLLPVTLLIASSRVVLGLHYPSDVLAGAAVGTLIASVALLLA